MNSAVIAAASEAMPARGSLLLKVFSAAAPNCCDNLMRQATPMTQVSNVIQRCR